MISQSTVLFTLPPHSNLIWCPLVCMVAIGTPIADWKCCIRKFNNRLDAIIQFSMSLFISTSTDQPLTRTGANQRWPPVWQTTDCHGSHPWCDRLPLAVFTIYPRVIELVELSSELHNLHKYCWYIYGSTDHRAGETCHTRVCMTKIIQAPTQPLECNVFRTSVRNAKCKST